MDINFQCKVYEEHYCKSMLGLIVKKFIKEIDAPQITSLNIIPDSKFKKMRENWSAPYIMAK